MNLYEEIKDNAILDYETSKIVVYEESKFMYTNRPYVLNKWKEHAYHTTTEEIVKKSPTDEMGSFAVLYEFVIKALLNKRFYTKEEVRETIRGNIKPIEFTLKDKINEEFSKYEATRSPNEEFVNDILDDDFLFANMEPKIKYFKDTLRDQGDWLPVPNVGHVKTIKDNKKKVIGVAKIDTFSNKIENITSKKQQEFIERFKNNPIKTLGHDTTDVFVVLSHFLMSNQAETTEDGYTYFSSDDALSIMGRSRQKRPNKEEFELSFKEEDRFKIMQQVMNLDMTWVAFSEDNKELKIINGVMPTENELYEFQDYVKLFDINRVNHAFDKKTGEYKGIYGVYIKPSEYLRPFLREIRNEKQFAAISLKLVQYTVNRQPVAKNLGEFIAWMFKIASNTHKADIIAIQHKVSTLIKEAGLTTSKVASLRESLEKGLDTLLDDRIISGWSYKDLDPDIIGKPGYKKKWLNSTIIIDAPKNVIEINRALASTHPSQLIDLDFELVEEEHQKQVEVIENFEQQSFELIEENPIKNTSSQIQDITPDVFKEIRKELGISMRKAAVEIGISAPTLSRFENGTTTPNDENKQLINEWGLKHLNI
ncbi:helix-turn-helix domain-containing protein [Cytobacillus praedii]|uniref:helix-turn-helix domain-containing protein n=1 Tax=Cytobacillus praedii TaxID=1742358 RepID=UPI003F80A707